SAVTCIATSEASAAWSFPTAALTSCTHSVGACETYFACNTGSASLTFSLGTTLGGTSGAGAAPAVTEALANDTGASSTDRTTSDPTLNGTADVNAVVHFIVDGSAIAATATANASGAWSYLPTGLAEGTHTIVASETNT